MMMRRSILCVCVLVCKYFVPTSISRTHMHGSVSFVLKIETTVLLVSKLVEIRLHRSLPHHWRAAK